MIKEIYLENWKSHLKSRIVFSKGVNLILGKIGSGKSSIFEAICYSFFGTFPDLNSKKVKLEDVIMKKPVEKSFSEILLKFSFKNNEYELRRRIEKGKSSYAELKENNKIVEVNSENVNKFLEKLLKIDYETFYNIIFGEQNKIDYILSLPKGQRKEKIDEMLGIEILEKYRKTTVSVKNRLNSIFLEKRKSLEKLEKENIKEKLEKERNNYFELLKKREDLKNKAENLSIKLKDLEEKLKEGKKLKEKYVYLKSEKDQLLINLDSIEKKIRELREVVKNVDFDLKEKLSEVSKNLESVKSEKEKLKAELENLQKKLAEINYKIKVQKEVEEEINKLNKEIEIFKKEVEKEKDLKKRFEEIEKEIEEIKNKRASIITKKDFYSNILNNLEKVEGICPVCGRDLEIHKKQELIEEYQSLLKNLEKEKEETEKHYLEKEREMVKIKNSLEEIKKIFERFAIYEKRIEELKSRREIIDEKILDTLEKEYESKKLELISLEKNLENLLKEQKNLEFLMLKLEELKNLEKEKEETEKRVFELINEIEKIENLETFKNLEKIEEEYLKLNKEKSFLDAEIKNIDFNISILEKLILEYEKKLKEEEELRNEIKRIEKLIKDFEILEKSIRETQTIVRNNLIDAINYYLNIYWSELYPYKDYESLRILPTEDDYLLQFKDILGRWIELEKVASGGERTIAALCLRIALAKVLASQIDILILDEPTHNLDENSIKELARVLNEKLPQIFSQIFVITHDERFENLLNANVIKLERDKINDQPTIIIQE
ncbi:MAG: SMC family ATPase [Candidatus Aenigmatarchaeota archaeon]